MLQHKTGKEQEVSKNAAGLFLFCNTITGPKFLIVLNRWGSKTWGFPKGHIDRKDKGDDVTTALRETEEETGFCRDCITVHCPVGSVVYPMPKPTRNVPSGIKHVVFFVAEIAALASGEAPSPRLSKEHTAAGWVTLDEAADRVHPAHANAIEKTRIVMSKIDKNMGC